MTADEEQQREQAARREDPAGEREELVDDLLREIPRTAVVPAVQATLSRSRRQSAQIVQAFDDFVARPLSANLSKLHGRDLAKRNPMIYTVRGIDTVEEWPAQVLSDRETSAIEGHVGTWMEEVARLVSGGIKPGSGVDLQLTGPDGVVQLYALQSAPNTKNAGGRKSDIDALRRGALPLRGHRQQVELYVAVLSGRKKTLPLKSAPDVTILSSDDFWERVSGIPDFRARLLRSTTILAWLVQRRSRAETTRIIAEACSMFGDTEGRLDLEALLAVASGSSTVR
jgi:type II restriction endonuclease EcoO109I-like protein